MTPQLRRRTRSLAFLFDLDGTLVDSVYHHVIAWHRALTRAGITLSVWRIHRRIGMSGGLFVHALMRELPQRLTAEQISGIQEDHARHYLDLAGDVRPLPGAGELLATLSDRGVPWAIATSGHLETARAAQRPPKTTAPVTLSNSGGRRSSIS